MEEEEHPTKKIKYSQDFISSSVQELLYSLLDEKTEYDKSIPDYINCSYVSKEFIESFFAKCIQVPIQILILWQTNIDCNLFIKQKAIGLPYT